jgi:hypothetical protein
MCLIGNDGYNCYLQGCIKAGIAKIFKNLRKLPFYQESGSTFPIQRCVNKIKGIHYKWENFCVFVHTLIGVERIEGIANGIIDNPLNAMFQIYDQGNMIN